MRGDFDVKGDAWLAVCRLLKSLTVTRLAWWKTARSGHLLLRTRAERQSYQPLKNQSNSNHLIVDLWKLENASCIFIKELCFDFRAQP